MKDVVIIGAGPAGLSAAIYAVRAMMDVVVVEKGPFSGGQIINSEKVDNYLGLNGVSGFELATKYKEHADALGVTFMDGQVEAVEDKNDYKIVKLKSGDTIEARNVVVATGARHKSLGAKGEDELKGLGVSYCATCDGAFFRNKTVAVVGGGDVALGDALYLSNVCEKVYLINRREGLRASKATQDAVFSKPNVEFLPNYVVKELKGDGMLASAVLESTNGVETKELEISGIFVAVGMEPVTDYVKGVVELDDRDYVVAGEDCRTSVKGIYVAGDARTKELRQLVTAVADGANVIYSIERDM